jgi:hypothetical protein
VAGDRDLVGFQKTAARKAAVFSQGNVSANTPKIDAWGHS